MSLNKANINKIHNSLTTLFTGKQLVYREEVDSTNNYLQQMIREERPPEGAAVITAHQSGGRGQRSNVWRSQPGKNLLCSIYLKPRFLKPHESFMLNKLVSVSVIKAIRNLGIKNVAVKWPNDVFIGNRKAGGVLIETGIKAKAINSAVIGIGININQTDFYGEARATSLALECGQQIDADEVFVRLCGNLERGYMNLKKDLSDPEKEYHEFLWGKNDFHLYQTAEGKQQLKVKRVTTEGFLVSEDHGGKQHIFEKYELKLL